ncbi:anti-sigma factor antagonist [Streptomyces sp. TLI_171]|uniref:anti-sigma factor antagonist n=1 Tax=Streptomyces sp. TLI_171 TaxID=1938859 RepID=UPI000C1971BE|nr:anti-sigma factor antagonist [Streptomyces sp. TLI_171]RKE17338.1 anti-sigma B factor antagonist [Streptomyces sp. TLI_171]
MPVRADSAPTAGPPPGPHLTATTTRLGHTAVCHLAGDLDVDTRERAAAALARAAAEPHHLVCVVLRDIDFLACAGLTTLLEARAAALAADRSLALVDPSPPVRRVLELTGTGSLFPVLADLPRGDCPTGSAPDGLCRATPVG